MHHQTDLRVVVFWLVVGILGGFVLGLSFYHSVFSYPTEHAISAGYARYNEEKGNKEWIPLEELKND